METISDDQIKYILGRRQMLLKQLRRRMENFYKDMDTAGDLIRSASMGSASGEKIGGSSSHSTDLSDVLSRYRHLIREQEVEMRVGLLRLVEEQERINRVWVCYQALPVEEYEVVTELYVKRKLYKTAEDESGMNHRQFEKIRKKALNRIRALSMGSYSNVEIMSMKEAEYEQLCLELD